MSSDLSYPRKFKFSYPTVDTRTSKKQLSPLYSVDSIKRTVLLNVLLPKKNLDYLTYHILENLKADKFCDFKNLLCLDLKILLCLDFSILLCLDFKKP